MSCLKRTDWFNLAIVMTIAAATRIYQLGHASLWFDESTTILMARLPWSTLWVTAYDPTPPLYYSVIKVLLNFGHSEFLLRLPSVIFAVLTVAIIYITTTTTGGAIAHAPTSTGVFR